MPFTIIYWSKSSLLLMLSLELRTDLSIVFTLDFMIYIFVVIKLLLISTGFDL